MPETTATLKRLVNELLEGIWDAWYEGASDCHTSGEEEHYADTSASKLALRVTGELAQLEKTASADRMIALLNDAESLSKGLGITDPDSFNALRFWAETAKESGGKTGS